MKYRSLIASLLAGGTLFAGCEMRLRDAAVQGTQLFIISLLSPDNFSLDIDGMGTADGS